MAEEARLLREIIERALLLGWTVTALDKDEEFVILGTKESVEHILSLIDEDRKETIH